MKFYLFSMLIALLTYGNVNAQHCCEDSTCRQKAHNLAAGISNAVAAAGQCSQDASKNAHALDSLKVANPSAYNNLLSTAKQVNDFIDQIRQDTCFMRALPEDESDNIFDWLIYLKAEKPKFPSSEFCTGWKRRLELGQGAINVFHNKMAYLGSLRGYLVYAIGKKGDCGNKIRLMTGPALFLQNRVTYATLSSRVSYRLKDIAPIPFSIGNINLFGEYTTSFRHFEYAAIGGEVELGVIGLNLSIIQNLQSHHQGFLAGVVFANKKL